ncbi:hypothetical protein NADFUDRAFT_81707 [Nadsonia fulvescens var. elongata DSM 6958]|uniref:Protein transport protein SEC23 n=1 Tax=Nadsonia fulvescens var. elongata DSM 6958 TaxID=857566 RepID=A0A1E3PNX0_9ASCO|nr:hypothetical protein NADFUDRAFT_81707 [Nadsonia fulvescens var. elongata DSM 6958]
MAAILEELQPDSFSIASAHRARRATGAAIRLALTILSSAFPSTVARLMLFNSGPCTIGPGSVVDISYKHPIRSHHDIKDNNAKHFVKAAAYYDSLAKVATSYGIVVDIFAGCYDQVGLAEMAALANRTGGAMVITDDFQTSIFKQSFQRLLSTDTNGDLQMAFNANFEIKTSTNLKICGLLGQAISLNNKSKHVSESTEIGIAKTSSWKMCGLTPHSTYTVFFEIGSKQPTMTPANVPGSNASPQQAQGLIQYITHYQHSSGTFRLRVTTVARALYPGSSPLISQSFDQETAAVVLAKLAMYKFESGKMSSDEVIKWVDKLLVQLCAKFGEYRRDDVASFRLGPAFSMLPQFIFHLRRSQFLQVFNNSPDETTFYRHTLMTEDVSNGLIMIQPSLTRYAIDEDPAPVLLDSLSVKPDTILLLDTFFHILIYHGETIAAWRKAGYQDNDEYSNFRALLAQPRADAAELLFDRFPLPRFIDTEAGGSQARFLFSKLNPTNSYREMDGFGYQTLNGPSGVSGGIAGATVVLTDDVSLQGFMLHLSKLCVSSKEA